jgi:hypothetical protein
MKVQVKVIEARERSGISQKTGKSYKFVGVMFQDAEGHVFEGNLDPEKASVQAFLQRWSTPAGKGHPWMASLEPFGKYREPRLADLVAGA